mmetsp:Transcript_58013/g.179997  ORF Transcript_58013/g.179997 Transcript_58013/m.179997 type:complete len:214 (-) Transcript_58013:21-662(-)
MACCLRAEPTQVGCSIPQGPDRPRSLQGPPSVPWQAARRPPMRVGSARCCQRPPPCAPRRPRCLRDLPIAPVGSRVAARRLRPWWRRPTRRRPLLDHMWSAPTQPPRSAGDELPALPPAPRRTSRHPLPPTKPLLLSGRWRAARSPPGSPRAPAAGAACDRSPWSAPTWRPPAARRTFCCRGAAEGKRWNPCVVHQPSVDVPRVALARSGDAE